MDVHARRESTAAEMSPRLKQGLDAHNPKTPLRAGTPRRALGDLKNSIDRSRFTTPAKPAPTTTPRKTPSGKLAPLQRTPARVAPPPRVLSFDDDHAAAAAAPHDAASCARDDNANRSAQRPKSAVKLISFTGDDDATTTTRPSLEMNAAALLAPFDDDEEETIDRCSCTHCHRNELICLIDSELDDLPKVYPDDFTLIGM